VKYPAFIQEMASEANRGKLLVGIWSGYTVAAVFGALAAVAQWQGIIAFTWAYYALIGAKYATNTLAWWSLRTGKLVLETAGLNLVADMTVITGAIYLTGAQLSPLFSVYVIVIAVVAMLSNRGVTVLAAILAVAAYALMSLLVYTGVLPAQPPPVEYAGGLTPGYVAIDFAIRFGLLAALTYYLTAVLRVLREREVALEHKTAALVEASRHRREFTTNITHELRTPIQGILGLTELIESGVYGAVSDKQREAMAGIRRSADGLLHMVDDLLQLARAESGRLEVKRSRFAVESLLQEAVAAARWMQGRKRLDVELSVAPDVPELESDPVLLGRVVVNLLSNAIKFTPEGGRVSVTARARAGGIEIAVADTGIGIPPEELPHVFEEFRQVDGSSSRRYGGAGVGLSLVRTATAALGGEVTAVSAPGKGATFTIHLPA
jgi:signal transduction histidine kinase